LGAEVRVKGLQLQNYIYKALKERGYLVFKEYPCRADVVFFSKNHKILFVCEVKNYVIPKNKMRKIVYRLNKKKRRVAEHFQKLGFKFNQVIPVLIAQGFERKNRRCLCFSLRNFLTFFT